MEVGSASVRETMKTIKVIRKKSDNNMTVSFH